MPKLHFNHHRHADLPLHYGHVPQWLAKRMTLLGGAIVEAIVMEYGKSMVLQRLSDPFWFQALGCVMGMDWHSSGITTSVMGALKRGINPRFNDLGIYICGGKGKHSRSTPEELMGLSHRTGLNGDELVRTSRLTAKVDNNAIQDGFQIYLHNFVVTNEGEWTVVQQGMNESNGMARRYHWYSQHLKSFVEEPHTFIYGENQGEIINLTDSASTPAKSSILQMVKEDPAYMLPEIRKIVMPSHHDVRAADVNLKRLGATLVLAHEREINNFEALLLLEGVGPRTVQSLALVSEVIHGTPSRFNDPARFSFAHGGKDGHPFPVPTKVYDQTIQILETSIAKAKLGDKEKLEAIKNLSFVSRQLEGSFQPDIQLFDKVIQHERNESWRHGGRTVFGRSKRPEGSNQLDLFM